MAFNKYINYPAKPAFGAVLESDDAGNYIQNKAAKTIFCNASKCPQTSKVKNQSDLLLLRQARNLAKLRCDTPYNSLQLYSNLYTKMNISNVCIINTLETNTCPETKINPSNDFFDTYVIDSNGSLFGNDQCGLNNFLNYRENDI